MRCEFGLLCLYLARLLPLPWQINYLRIPPSSSRLSKMKEQWVPMLASSKSEHNKWSDQNARFWPGAKDREPAVGSFQHCFPLHQGPQNTSSRTASRIDVILPCGRKKKTQGQRSCLREALCNWEVLPGKFSWRGRTFLKMEEKEKKVMLQGPAAMGKLPTLLGAEQGGAATARAVRAGPANARSLRYINP